MMRLEHIGIAIADAEKSQRLFNRLLGKTTYKTEKVDAEKVTTHFYDLGNTKLELIAGHEEGNVIDKFIEKRSEGIHHLAFEVDNLQEEIKRLKEEGFDFINDVPKRGADDKLICFLHPKTTNGVLVELCQSM